MDEQFLTAKDDGDDRVWCTACLRWEWPRVQTHYMADYFSFKGNEGCD